MEALKTYEKVHPEKESVNFNIFKMEDVFTRRNGNVDAPHRHNYYTVLIVDRAKGQHKIDFNTYDLANKQIFFVSPGQVHQIIEKEKSTGFVMAFSNQFLIENSIRLSFVDSLNLFNNYGHSPPLNLKEHQFDGAKQTVDKIFCLFGSDINMKFLAIGALLKVFLIECNNICSINPIELDVDSSGDNLIRAFKRKVEQNYKEQHSTSFYADELNITADHLNRTVKAKIGETAKNFIQTRIITEAKRLLYFSDLSNKEIGYELGFNEPANFSAFFKKHTQLSPSKFKKNERRS